MMQKLPYKGFKYQGICFADTTTINLDEILNTPDDRDHGYYIVCDIDYTNCCKDRTEQLALRPNKRKINVMNWDTKKERKVKQKQIN